MLHHEAFFDELEKISKIFGRKSPDESLIEPAVPYHLKRKLLDDYVRDKAKEEPTGLGKALVSGALVGGVLGGATGYGAWRGWRGGRGALLGAGVGAIGGAGVGALMRAGDKREVETMRDIREGAGVPGGKERMELFAAAMIGRARARDELSRELRKERRHQELTDAILGRDRGYRPYY